MKKYKLEIYMDHGLVFEYEVDSPEKVREHADAIAKTGFRHNTGKLFELYPPHRIVKIKCEAEIPTNYIDKVRGT